MELSKQVCTLEQAKKLHELGIDKFKGLFRWCVFCPDPLGDNHYYEAVYGDGMDNALPGEYIADALTVAELGVMLPDCVSTNSSTCGAEFISRKSLGDWSVGYDRDMATEGGYGADVKSLEHHIGGFDQPEAWVRADMLIYLLKNNLIVANDCNARLISN